MRATVLGAILPTYVILRRSGFFVRDPTPEVSREHTNYEYT